MLCTPAHLSLIAKMAHEADPNINPATLFHDLYLQNIAAIPADLIKEARLHVPVYDPTIRTASLLPVQKIEAIIEFQEACAGLPVFDQTSIKHLTDSLLRRQCKQLEGYGAAFVHSMKQLATRLDPLDFPPPTVSPESIHAEAKERGLG